MPMKHDREYRTMPVMTEVRNESDDSFIVEGYASTFETYLMFEDGHKQYYERIEPTAFDQADMKDVLFLYNHAGQVMARQKNGSLRLDVDEKGLHVVADLSGSNRAREMFEEIRNGLIDQMSFAFVVDDDRFERDDNKVTRVISRMRKLYDVSAVSIPANPTTSIYTRSWIDGEIEREEAERLQREEAEARKQEIEKAYARAKALIGGV